MWAVAELSKRTYNVVINRILSYQPLSDSGLSSYSIGIILNFVTFDEPMGIHTSLWCSMVLDFSGQLRKERFNSYWFTAFTRQGSQPRGRKKAAHIHL
jgi:hypothetical protein